MNEGDQKVQTSGYIINKSWACEGNPHSMVTTVNNAALYI